MSRIHKKFQTKYTVMEMKNFINANILPNSAVQSFIDSSSWVNDELFIKSKLGSGKIILRDYYAEVDIELNFLGKMAKGTLESTLDKEFKQLSN